MRRYVRVPVERPVYVSSPAEKATHGTVWSHELGEGGCLLVSDEFYGVGRILIVDIVLDTTRPVRAIGKVLYEYRDLKARVCTGIGFQYVDKDQQRRLRDYILDRVTCQTVDVELAESEVISA